jgi:hypothetical protein
MSEELTNKLLQYLNSGEVFLKEQAPDYVNQWMAFAMWDAYFGLIVSIVFFLLSIVAILGGLYFVERSGDASEMFGAVLVIFGSITFLVSAFCIPCSYSNLKKLELAPKVYMLESLTHRSCK